MVEKLNQAEKANVNVFAVMNTKLQDTEFLQQSTMTAEETKVVDLHYDPYWGMNKAELAALSSNSPSGLNDADVKCYGARYSDITGWRELGERDTTELDTVIALDGEGWERRVTQS